MKQQTSMTVKELLARNDAVLRSAAKGEPAFICVHKETGLVLTGLSPRPLYYDADMATAEPRPNTHRYIMIDPKDPLRDVEQDDQDRWVYKPNDPDLEQTLLHIIGKSGEPEHQAMAEQAVGVNPHLPVADQDHCPVCGHETDEIAECPNCDGRLDVSRIPQEKLEQMFAQDLPMAELTPVVPQIIVRHSELVDAASCLHGYNLKWIKNLRPKKQDPKLTIGTLFHAFQEVYEITLTFNDGPDPLEEGLAALDQKAQAIYDTLPSNDMQGHLDMKKDWDFARAVCQNYHKWRTTDPVGMELSDIQQAEATFCYKIGAINGVEVWLSGTMDGAGVTRVTEESELWLREYKTCQSIKAKLETYRTDKQTRRYVGIMRLQGVPFRGVELVLAAKTLPLADEDFLLKAKGREGYVTIDMDKWNKASYEQALRIGQLGKFDDPDFEKDQEGKKGKKGLTEQGFHDILESLKDKPNPFFHVERLYFNDHELDEIMAETLIEGYRLHVTRETSKVMGEMVFTRNPGPMSMNCKCCSVRDLCEMALKGVDTDFHISEHFIVDATIHEGKETDDTDD